MASSTELNELPPPPDINPRPDPALDFRDRELEEMTPADYATLGFMAGLEVHQQLATPTKLFCRCPVGRYEEAFDAEVLRHMRPTLSELGEYDGTALMEFKTRKEIVYRLNRATVCTYEIDDTPPFEMSADAIKTALEVCLLFNLNLVSELHVMRKQYLDGSIPAGFQRTAMMGIGGSVPFRVPELGLDRTLNIRQLSLEEDGCREASDVGHRVTFITDRLGTPLTEVVTEPELMTPWEVQAGARLVARLTRATGKVRRGGGAARQDVNVSIAGGRRVEIKGVSHHRGLPRLTHIEAFRQLNLLRVRAELHKRGVDAQAMQVPQGGNAWDQSPLVHEVSPLLRRSDYAPLRDTLDQREAAVAVRLPGFAGLLVHRTQPGVTFAGEFADRVRVIACLTGRPFMIHSDIEGYGLSTAEWRQVRNALGAQPTDAVIVLWGPAQDLDTAAREVLIRAAEATQGVPAETRQSFADCTTGFERILPGADRMYPDTDTPPVPIPDAWVDAIHLPERPWDRAARYLQQGLDALLAYRLADHPCAELFDALDPAPGETARRVAHALEKRIIHHQRNGVEAPTAQRLDGIVRRLESGALHPQGFEAALDALTTDPRASADALLRPFSHTGNENNDLEKTVAAMISAAHGLHFTSGEARRRWSMGQVMPAFRGRLAAETVEAACNQAWAKAPEGWTHD